MFLICLSKVLHYKSGTPLFSSSIILNFLWLNEEEKRMQPKLFPALKFGMVFFL